MAEAAKAAGNAAVKAQDYQAAIRHYTAALEALPGVLDAEGTLLRATLLCNRCHARQQCGELQLAVHDATSALAQLPPSAPGAEKLRVKALYRRGLARETLGETVEASHDFNLALRLAPSNSGLTEAAQRMRKSLSSTTRSRKPPPHVRPDWRPEHLFSTKDVMGLADADCFPKRCRGFTSLGADPTVRFPNGLGVSAYHADGGLAAIWPLGQPRLLSRTQEAEIPGPPMPPEVGGDWFQLPNMAPGDGFHIKYGKSGDLRWITPVRNGQIHGIQLRFELDGHLRPAECGLFDRGRCVERWQNSLLPEGYAALALIQMAIPVKKALKIGLSLGERRICFESCVNIDAVPAADLNGQAPDRPDLDKVAAPAERSALSPNSEWWRSSLQVVDPARQLQEEPLTTEGSHAQGWAPVGLGTGQVLPDLRGPLTRNDIASNWNFEEVDMTTGHTWTEEEWLAVQSWTEDDWKAWEEAVKENMETKS